jgi:hypothetical protein
MRRTLLLSVIATLAITAPAQAAIKTYALPSKAGKPSTLTFELNALQAPVSGALPTSLVFSASGYSLNLLAAPGRCSYEQGVGAQPDECPADSMIGSGSLTVGVYYNGQFHNTAFTRFLIYLNKSGGVYLELPDLAGGRDAVGTIGRSGGIQLAFNPVPQPVHFGGLSYTFNSLNITLGGSRVVTVKYKKTVKIKVNGKTKKVTKTFTKKVREYLVTNPSHCTGSYATSITIGVPTLGPQVESSSVACSA